MAERIDRNYLDLSYFGEDRDSFRAAVEQNKRSIRLLHETNHVPQESIERNQRELHVKSWKNWAQLRYPDSEIIKGLPQADRIKSAHTWLTKSFETAEMARTFTRATEIRQQRTEPLPQMGVIFAGHGGVTK